MIADTARIAELIQRETGISIKTGQLSSLEAALRRIDPTMTAADLVLASPRSVDGAALLEQIIDEVSIKETFYFRQRGELDAIDWPRLVQNARAAGSDRARVWVAACATGEEAYTLAILASLAFETSPPPVSIHATDISVSALAHAQRGRYGRRSTRFIDERDVERYLTIDGNDLVVGASVRSLVQFSRQNLIRDPIPAGGGPFDLVACRNVLIYFEPDTVGRVVSTLTHALTAHGTLLLGAADRLASSAHELVRMHDSKPAVQHGAKSPPSIQPLRRPLGRERPEAPPIPAASRAGSDLNEALKAANMGDLQLALDVTGRVLDDDPLDSHAYFISGLVYRRLGHAEEAVHAFRSALYVEPGFGLAAFEMGRAHEACGDTASAARAYRLALGGLDPTSRDDRFDTWIDVGDVAAACAIRLRALGASSYSRTRPAAEIGLTGS